MTEVDTDDPVKAVPRTDGEILIARAGIAVRLRTGLLLRLARKRGSSSVLLTGIRRPRRIIRPVHLQLSGSARVRLRVHDDGAARQLDELACRLLQNLLLVMHLLKHLIRLEQDLHAVGALRRLLREILQARGEQTRNKCRREHDRKRQHIPRVIGVK